MNIKDYLHLYLGCDVYVFPDDTLTSGWLTKQLKKQPTLSYKYQLSIGNYKSTLDGGYKPILRPLSDMTEQEEKEMIATQDDVKLDGYPEILLKTDSGETFRWMLSKGFDLFGLIEAGLAINKTKGLT